MPSYVLLRSRSRQRAADTSFIGGTPRIPGGVPIPTCHLCSHEQSFFFQVAFPEGHPWAHETIAVFSCTSCYDEDRLIPALLPTIRDARIPSGFLTRYQVNFRFLVFPTAEGVPRSTYKPAVAYCRLDLERASHPAVLATKVGGSPRWITGNERPHSYAGKYSLAFLLQFRAVPFDDDDTFKLVRSAPGQMAENYFSGKIEQSKKRRYELFVGNELYFFGTLGTKSPLVYCLPQKP